MESRNLVANDVTRASENDVKTRWLTLMCGIFYGKIVINSSVGTKSVQEKEFIIRVRYGQTKPHDAKTVTLGTDLSVRT